MNFFLVCEIFKHVEIAFSLHIISSKIFYLQADMRDFLNAPNGTSKQSLPANKKQDVDISQSPLGGRTVWNLT